MTPLNCIIGCSQEIINEIEKIKSIRKWKELTIDNYKKFTNETEILIRDLNLSAHISEHYNLSMIKRMKIGMN